MAGESGQSAKLPAPELSTKIPASPELARLHSQLEHAYNTTLIGDEQTLQSEEGRAAYQRQLLGLGENEAKQRIVDRAVSEGIGQSGIAGERTTNESGRVQLQENQLTKGEQESQKKAEAANMRSYYETEDKMAEDVENHEKLAKQEAIENANPGSKPPKAGAAKRAPKPGRREQPPPRVIGRRPQYPQPARRPVSPRRAALNGVGEPKLPRERVKAHIPEQRMIRERAMKKARGQV